MAGLGRCWLRIGIRADPGSRRRGGLWLTGMLVWMGRGRRGLSILRGMWRLCVGRWVAAVAGCGGVAVAGFVAGRGACLGGVGSGLAGLGAAAANWFGCWEDVILSG